MRNLLIPFLASFLLISVSAQAEDSFPDPVIIQASGAPVIIESPPPPVIIQAPAANNGSDLFSFGVGWMNFDKSEHKTHSSDYRFEYRFGYRFLGDEEFSFHPFVGFEMSSRDLLYGLGGFAMDWNFSPHYVFTWSEGAGYLDSGKQRSLGGTFQFRSMAEFGYRFDNDVRLTAEFSHISDAKLTRVNPGAEIIGTYVHVPIQDVVEGLVQ